MKTIICIPAWNEEKTIGGVVADAFDYAEDVIVCDDGSKDRTAKIAESQGCVVLTHKENMGKGAAMRSLFEEAIKMKAESVITIDADGQHDAKEIPKLLYKIDQGFDVVIGSRTGMEGYRAIGNKILSASEFDTQSGFRAYRGSVLSKLIPSEMGMAVDSEILQKAEENDLRIAQIPISVNYSVPNPHKTNTALHFLDVLMTTFKLATFRHPLLLFGIPGLAFIFLAAYFGYKAIPRLFEEGLGSLFLALIGLSSLSTGITIWVLVTMVRRTEK